MKKHFLPLYEDVDTDNLETVREADIRNLPAPVQTYLRFTGIIGKKEIKTVELKQEGVFRPKIDGKWIPMTAIQFINSDAMGFIWKAKASIVRVLDQFVNGKGNLKVKLFGVITVGNVGGPEINQGEALRFLAEIIWFPSAFTKEYIKWDDVDGHTADATLFYSDHNTTARFHFRESGEIEKITAKRYRENKGKFSLDDWVISNLEYKSFSGIVIPYKAHVSWEFEDLSFCYDKFELTEVSFNGRN